MSVDPEAALAALQAAAGSAARAPQLDYWSMLFVFVLATFIGYSPNDPEVFVWS